MYLAIAEFLFVPFFSGFAIWSAVYFLTKREFLAGYNVENADNFIVRAVIFLGIIHFLVFLIHIFLEGIDISEYRFGFWICPIAYFVLSQLLWFRKIRENRVFRLIMAVCFFVVIYLETFIILTSGLNLNLAFVTNSLELLGYFVLNVLITFLIFVTLVVSGMEIKSWIRNE